mgnify:CR=1 FL=1
MRDYIYIPLQNKFSGSFGRIFISLLVFFVGTTWYGISANFLLWGLFHFLFWAIEVFLISLNPFKKISRRYQKIANLFKIGFTFSLISILWVFFLTNDLSQVMMVYKKIFLFGSLNIENYPVGMTSVCIIFCSLMIAMIFSFLKQVTSFSVWYAHLKFEWKWLSLIIILVTIFMFGNFGIDQKNFLY